MTITTSTAAAHAAFGLGATVVRAPRWSAGTTDDGVPYESDGATVRIPLIRALTADPIVSDALADLISANGADASDHDVRAASAVNVAETLAQGLAVKEDVLGILSTLINVRRVPERVSATTGKATPVTYRLDRGRGGKTLPLGAGPLADALRALADAVAEDVRA